MLENLNGVQCLISNATVIKVIEFGEKTWDDSFNFQDIENMVLSMQPLARQVGIEKSNKMGGHVADRKPPQSNKMQKIMFCTGYQTGECKEGDIHNDVIYKKTWVVQHICANCWRSEEVMRNHPAFSAVCPYSNIKA